MKKYCADFETTVEENSSRVWAWGFCEIGNIDNFNHGTTIQEFFEWCRKENKVVYFHNLKFDGAFLLDYLLKNGFRYSEKKEDNTFNTIISSTGQFYQIEVIFQKKNKKYRKVTFLDSLKKLPFKVEKIAKDFGLPFQKLEIDYKRERPLGYVLTPEEIDYLRNDVQIVATALGLQFDEGLKKMTTGADALGNYKDTFGKDDFSKTFPVLPLHIDGDIRQAYRGGFAYVNKRYKGKDVKEGIVFDVNSLYPSVMCYRPMPYGVPLFFEGKYEPDSLYPLHIQQLVVTFRLKPNKIPMIQLKNNLSFLPTEYIEDSGIEPICLVLTNVDLEIFFEHYDVIVHEYVNGWKFKAYTGFFNEYIDKWMKIKVENTGARRLWAKLMLNSLYGKFATNPDVTGKYPYLKENVVAYKMKEKEFREPIYTPVGVFITSWARHLTITTAQKVYPRFIYADTDSIHLEGTEPPEEIEVHPSKLGAWKHEGTFTRARFIRAKTYIEEIDGKIHTTCAGMPEQVKKLVTWTNFQRVNENMFLPCRDGYFYGKLLPKQVDGGIVLKETVFTIN